MGDHSETDDQSEQPLYELVSNDKFYQEVEARLGDPNERDNGGRTLLHLAAWSLKDNSKIFQLLLDKGADVNAVTPDGYTPLIYAVCIKKRRNVVALLEAGASVNAQDHLGRSVLHFATTRYWPNSPSPILLVGFDIWLLERLLCHPEINPNLGDGEGDTPLKWAVKEKNCIALEALLKRGANPNIPNIRNQTPLHAALSAQCPSFGVVKPLLTNGAGIYCKDVFGRTPMGNLFWNISFDVTRRFAMKCIELIAFRYQIKDSFKRQLERIPKLSNCLDVCCGEVKLMKEMRIHAKFNLHDFALDGFQARIENPVQTVYMPLVEALLTGLFTVYFDMIFCRISRDDLRRVLERTVGRRPAENLVPNDANSLTIYDAIWQYYEENEVLKNRVFKYRNFLEKMLRNSC